jgi:uncharacterized protein YcbK (DUF882 family)
MKNFQLSEFDSPDAPGSGKLMDEELLNILDQMRSDAGIPFIITSGYRTLEHNKAVGGKPNSAHTRGLAVDISAPDSKSKYLIIRESFVNGVSRIGIGKTFIHIDLDKSLPQNVVWVY